MNAQEKESALKLLLGEYLESYACSKGKMQMRLWLAQELQEHLPGKPSGEITQITYEIITSLEIQQEKAKSLDEAMKTGMSKEKWFAREMKKEMSDLSEDERAEITANLGDAVSKAKSDLAEVIIGSSPEGIEVPRTLEGIAKDIGRNALMGNIVADDVILSGISGNEGNQAARQVIEGELQTGNDLGLKAAVAGAGYTAAERGLIEAPEENRPSMLAAIGNTVVEKVKAAGGFVKKTVSEGLQELECAAVSSTVGVFASLKAAVPSATLGAKIGYAVGGFLGASAGFVVGGVIGTLRWC